VRRAAARHARRHQVRAPLRELQHLQRLGVFDQLLDGARDGRLGADHAADGKAFRAQQTVVLAKVGQAQARDGGGDAEHVVCHLAGHQVGGVQVGAGDEQVAVVGAGVAQHRGLNAVAGHAAQLQPLLQPAQALGVGVDDGDVVGLRGQRLGHALPHAAGAKNQDLHRGRPPNDRPMLMFL